MIVLLVLAWAVVLIPSAMRPRFETSPLDGVREFERSMGILENARRGQRVPGRWVMVPKDLPQAPKRRRARVVRRRRQNFVRLLAAAGLTFVLGLVPGLRFLFLAHLVLDAGIALYVLQLRHWHRSEIERARKVRALPSEPPPVERVQRSG